uniref:Apple domain-containing protein n=1 Tax=Bactrocera latifrons TaxID=174628 RepID=A0A0K8VDD1_BACLA
MHAHTHTYKATVQHGICVAQTAVSTEMPKSTPPPAAQLRLSTFSQRQSFKRLLATVLLLCCLQLLHINCHGLLLKCPLYQMRLQKIVGFRPPLEYLTEQNLIYAPTYNFKDRNRHRREGYSVVGATDGQSHELAIACETASAICWRLCNEDSDCIAYVHLLDTNECYGYTYFDRQPRYQAIANELPLVADAEAVFYEKTCLKVPEVCKQRKWTLTKIPGTSLVFQGKKTIATLVTRRECAERCLFESEFKCLSASFAPSYRNNRERFSQHVPPEQHASNNQQLQQQQHQQQTQQNTLGRCILSDKDKMIQPDAFRAAPYDEEYMENQCYERPIENDSCSYELYANSSFIYAEAKYLGLTQKEVCYFVKRGIN